MEQPQHSSEPLAQESGATTRQAPVRAQPVPERSSAAVPLIERSIRASAFELLIVGGLCLFVGTSRTITWPAAASEAEKALWIRSYQVIHGSLAGVGALFILVAGLAGLGRRAAALTAALAEGLLAVVLLAWGIALTIEARVEGLWDAFPILLLIVIAMSLRSAMRFWRLYRGSAPAAAVIFED